MTITLNDEQARLLAEVVEAGAARSPDRLFGWVESRRGAVP